MALYRGYSGSEDAHGGDVMISNQLGQLVALLVVHYIGDFIFQSHWMGVNKSKNTWVLALHVLIYTWNLLLGSILIFSPTLTAPPSMLGGILTFVAVNGLLHFCTDFVTSRMTSALYANKEFHRFFCVIGLDQLIHQATLAATLAWLLG